MAAFIPRQLGEGSDGFAVADTQEFLWQVESCLGTSGCTGVWGVDGVVVVVVVVGGEVGSGKQSNLMCEEEGGCGCVCGGGGGLRPSLADLKCNHLS